jgi:hypothetical protein
VKVEICDRPVFVLGAPRSGTSMMQWALRQHPNLWGGQESDFLVPLVREMKRVWEFGSTRGKLHWLSGQKVDFDEFMLHVGLGVNSLYTNRSKGLRWVEQTPQYTLHIDDMLRMFPEAQFLVMVRDGRQVVESLRNFVVPVPFDEACGTWRLYNETARRFAEGEHGGQIHFVSYEGAVTDTEREMRALFAFLGEPYSQAPADRIKNRAPMNSSFAGEGRDQKLAPRWASWTSEERSRFDELAGDILIELGYESDHDWTGRTPADV